jgi:hypothetical protein
MRLVGAHLRVRPGNGQTRGSAPTDAGILQLEIEFVSSVRKRIGINYADRNTFYLRNLRNLRIGPKNMKFDFSISAVNGCRMRVRPEVEL